MSPAVAVVIGLSNFGTHGDGVWYQQAFPHRLQTTSPSVSLTAEVKQWEVGYTYLGRVKSDAMATPTDANYDVATKTCVGPCEDLSRFTGSGDVQGFHVKHRWDFNNLYLSAGAFFFLPRWRVCVTDWHAPGRNEPKSDFCVRHKAKPQIAPVLTVGYRATRAIAAEISGYLGVKAMGDEWPALYNGPVVTLSVRYTF